MAAEGRGDGGGRNTNALEGHDPQSESAQKEVMQFASQKEVVFDPDTMPQAVYPRGIPGMYGYYKPQPQPQPPPEGSFSDLQHADQQQPFYQYSEQPYPVQKHPEPTSASYSGSSTYSPSQHYPEAASQKQIPITPEEKAPSSRKGKRICGLAARTFYIVAGVIAVIIVAAVVGGAVGGTVSKHSKHGSGSTNSTGGLGAGGSSDNTTETNLLSDSRLAAVNWTDSSNFSHYAVFSQDKTNSIMVSLWDADNQTWTAVNVSAALEDAGSSISVKERSPLAAASSGPPDYTFEMHMYFLTETGNVGEIYTTDQAGKNWSTGDLMKAPSKTASDTSDLAAVWHRCAVGCAGDLYVAYEDDDQVINVLNSSDWSKTDTQIVANYQIDPSSGLAMIPFVSDSGKKTLNPGELRLYWDGSADLNEFKFNLSAVWEGGLQLAMSISTDPQPQYAASPFDNYVQTLLISRKPEGTLSGYRWDNVTWHTKQNITISGGPSPVNFSSIAMNMDGRFYGVMDGKIEEYSWFDTDPYTFTHVGSVDIINSTAT